MNVCIVCRCTCRFSIHSSSKAEQHMRKNNRKVEVARHMTVAVKWAANMRTEMTDIWLPNGKNGLMIMVLSNRRSFSGLK
jgi:hypothetical protein